MWKIDQTVSRTLRHIIQIFLPLLFAGYVTGISLFTHTHVVNGVTIRHSHPFDRGTEHSHSSAEFQLLHLLSQVLTDTAGFLSGLLPFFIPAVTCVVLAAPCAGTFGRFRGILSLRAPPF